MNPDYQRLSLADISCYTAYSAVDKTHNTLIALHMIGYEQAVRSNWAKLVTSKSVYNYINTCLVETQGSRDHVTMKTMLPESGWLDMWLIHKQCTIDQINPRRNPHFYIFTPDEALNTASDTLKAQFITLLDKAINIPILPEWSEYLWQEGDRKKLIQPINPDDCRNLVAYRVIIAAPAWASIISTGLKEGDITF
ncbi:MAG: hypothetical protein IAF02_19920 [Anaerolineae bacterium]|nr:hypothetical protein [Anaerolineae bacterium]